MPVVILAVSVPAAASFGYWAYGVLSALLLGGALWRWFVPTRYEMTDHGIGERVLGCERWHPWEKFLRQEIYRDGLLLSPFRQPSPLDPFRGVFIRFHGNREEVVALVKQHLDQTTR